MTTPFDIQGLEVLNRDPLVVKNPKTWYHIHSYGGWGKFFTGLAAGKLLSTRCTNSECEEKRLWLPPRCECPDCWHATEWIEAPTQGKVYSWSLVKYPGELFKLAAGTALISVELEGVCTKFMSYMKEGTPEIGMSVKAVFNTEKPTHTVLDVAWVPA